MVSEATDLINRMITILKEPESKNQESLFVQKDSQMSNFE